MKVFVAVFLCLVAVAAARVTSVATASSTAAPTNNPTPAPISSATPVPSAMPPPIDSTGEVSVSVNGATVSFSAEHPADDDDLSYTLQVVGTQEVYNNSGKWDVLDNTQVTNYSWTSSSNLLGFDQVGTLNDGTTLTLQTIVPNDNSTVLVQAVSIGGYTFSNDSAQNYLTLLFEWTATNSKGKEKDQKVLGNSNETAVVYGDAFYAIADITTMPAMIATTDEILTYDKKEKEMWLMIPYSAAAQLDSQGVYGINATQLGLSDFKTLASNGMPAWAIALIVVGSVLFLVAIIAAGVGGYMMYQKRRQGYEAI